MFYFYDKAMLILSKYIFVTIYLMINNTPGFRIHLTFFLSFNKNSFKLWNSCIYLVVRFIILFNVIRILILISIYYV